jgi:peptide/nickel transport system permease protein
MALPHGNANNIEKAMQRYLIYRLLQMIITLLIISLIVFFMVRLTGDPISVMAPPTFSEEQIAEMRRAWGFDRPIFEQYITFLRKALTGDFGVSVQYGVPAMGLVIDRLWWTYLLAGIAAVIALVIAIPLGIVSALTRNSWLDLASTALASLGTAMPSFWLGLMLILIFSVYLRLLPAFGAEGWTSVIMPAATLGVGLAARLSRLTRSSMLEVLGQDYIRTARSKGLTGTVVVVRHALRNALIPVTTAFGLQLGWLLGGAVIVESVFAWPGLGRLMIEAINIRDITIVQAGLFWFALTFMVLNLVVDLLYTVIDPRIRYT